MDTFEFKIKCFCLVIFLIAFTLVSKAQIDPHSPMPVKQVAAQSYDYSISGGEDFKASVYIEKNQYFYYTSSFDKKFTANISKFLVKKLGSPLYSENNIKEWETINGETIRSLYISLENGKVKIKSRNLNHQIIQSLQNIVEEVNEIVGAKLIANKPAVSVAKI